MITQFPELKQEFAEETSDYCDTSCGTALVKYESCESKKIKLEPSSCFPEIKYFTSKQKQTSQRQADDFFTNDISKQLRQNLGNLADEIHRTYLQAKVKCRPTNSTFKTFHQDDDVTTGFTSRRDVHAFIANLTEHFEHFATLQRYFLSLFKHSVLNRNHYICWNLEEC